MGSPEYLQALGRLQWQVADADYAMALLIMEIDREYQVLVDRPPSRTEVQTSAKYSQALVDRTPPGISDSLAQELSELAKDWVELVQLRNAFAHAWGFNDGTMNLLGGNYHVFKPNIEHRHVRWTFEQLKTVGEKFTAHSGRTSAARKAYMTERDSGR